MDEAEHRMQQEILPQPGELAVPLLGTTVDKASAPANGDTPARSRFRPLRCSLNLIVEADSTRSIVSRIRAAAILLAVLAVFGGAGYFVPAYLEQYFTQ